MVRQEMGRILKLINPKELRPAWVVDFPMFEKTEEGRLDFYTQPFFYASNLRFRKAYEWRERK